MPIIDSVQVAPLRETVKRAAPLGWVDRGVRRVESYPYVGVTDAYVDPPVSVNRYDTVWFDAFTQIALDADGKPIQDNSAVPVSALEEKIARMHANIANGLAREVDGGSDLALISTARNPNYYHFLFDDLSRLGFYERVPDWSGLKLVVTRPRPWQLELLKLAGVADRLLVLPPDPAEGWLYRLENVWISPRGLGVICNVRTVCAERLLRLGLSGGSEPVETRRLFISRAGTSHRRLANEAEIQAGLADRGFAIIRPESLPVREQISLFSGAEIVVGTFGAGLANCIFMQPGAALVELAPGMDLTSPGLRHNAIFVTIAGLAGLRYALVTGTESDERARELDLSFAWLEMLLDEVLPPRPRSTAQA